MPIVARCRQEQTQVKEFKKMSSKRFKRAIDPSLDYCKIRVRSAPNENFLPLQSIFEDIDIIQPGDVTVINACTSVTHGGVTNLHAIEEVEENGSHVEMTPIIGPARTKFSTEQENLVGLKEETGYAVDYLAVPREQTTWKELNIRLISKFFDILDILESNLHRGFWWLIPPTNIWLYRMAAILMYLCPKLLISFLLTYWTPYLFLKKAFPIIFLIAFIRSLINGDKPRKELSNQDSQPYLRHIRYLVRQRAQSFVVRLRAHPYLSVLTVPLILSVGLPASVFLVISLTMALLGIIVYAAAFFALTIASSLLIIPLLVMSFIFATLVIVFGFISNATFKMCQAIIFRVEGILHGIYFHMITISAKKKSK